MTLVAQTRKSALQISYVTMTYRSVLLVHCLVLALAALVMIFAFPDFYNRLDVSGKLGLGKVLAKGVLGGGNAAPESGPQQAHFTNIEWTVPLKKADGNAWMQADYSLGLERNHVVQTLPEGLAEVGFTDGTNYTVKPDSLIVVQQNSLNEAKQIQIAVQVTTGAVYLATSSIRPGSKSQVSIACATARIASDTSAQVMNDPRPDEHEILAKKGSVVADRGGESVKLADYERVSVNNESKEKVKSKEIGRPVLINPAKRQPVVLGVKEKTTRFSWSEVPKVRADHVRVSKTRFINPSSMIFDKNVTAAPVLVLLAEGAYYWEVQSIEENGKESAEKEKPARFMVTRKTGDNPTMALEVSDFVQHGHLIEAGGRIEPGAMVIINRLPAVVKEDGPFFHFTDLLPKGENMITLTSQNSKGVSKTIIRSVTIT